MNKLILALLIVLGSLKAGFAFDFSERPWLNPNIIKRVPSDYVPTAHEDFYLSVNHDWIKNAKLKPGYAANGSFYELEHELDANLRGLMTDETLKGHDAELVRNLYALWLDWESRNANGTSDLKKHVDKVEKIKSLDELTEYFKTEECRLHGGFIAGFGIGFDNEDSSFYNIELPATYLMLGDSAEYKTLTPNGERIKKMRSGFASVMLKKLGYDDDAIKKILDQSFEFENAIAASMMTHDEKKSPDALKKMYENPVTLEKLRELSPVFPFADILTAHKVFSDRMNLQEPAWLKALNELYTESQLENMKAYLIRNIASDGITTTDEESYREYQRLYNERYGINESAPDEELAADFVHGNLLTPLTKIYVERFISDKTKQDVTEIINDAIEYYREMLTEEDWLSESTRAKAIEKLDTIKPRVAYPDKWRDYSSLNIGTKESGETLRSALDKLNKFGWDYFYSRLNTKVDREMWGDNDAIIVNSYYEPSHNEIFIIAGILSGDFYNPERSREENLGGIGMVIGHELSHAFDTNGAQFDKNGSLKDWWEADDYKKFQARADRLINYLSGMTVTPEGQKYNGALVQTETIADMAGVKAMLGIAKKVKSEGKDFDYDKFFRAYAKIWCSVQTRENIDSRLKTDVHALPYIRVNAIVQQFEEFYKTYGVKSGDAMYLAPDDRVAVW